MNIIYAKKGNSIGDCPAVNNFSLLYILEKNYINKTYRLVHVYAQLSLFKKKKN